MPQCATSITINLEGQEEVWKVQEATLLHYTMC